MYILLNSRIKFGVETHIYTTKADELLMYVVFDKLIRKNLPVLHESIVELGIAVNEFAEDWFQNFFINSLPITSVVHIFSVYLNEGSRILYRAGLGMLTLFYPDLIQCRTKQNFLNMLHQLSIQLFSTEFLRVSYSFSLIDLKKSRNELRELMPKIEEPSTVYYRPKVEEESNIFKNEMWELIYEWLPTRIRIKDPVRIFRADEYGYNLRVFYDIMSDYSPTLVVLKAPNNHVFGVFMPRAWEFNSEIVTNQDTFLFTLHPTLQKYECIPDQPSILIETKSFHFGMGPDGFGLSVNEEWQATSNPCPTFNNPPLCGDDFINQNFSVMAIEVFTFA